MVKVSLLHCHIQTTDCHFSLCAVSSQSQSRPDKTGPNRKAHKFFGSFQCQDHKISSGKTLSTTDSRINLGSRVRPSSKLAQAHSKPAQISPNQPRSVQTNLDMSKPPQIGLKTVSDMSKSSQISPNRLRSVQTGSDLSKQAQNLVQIKFPNEFKKESLMETVDF